jgi:hypothetical protein
MSSIRVTLDHRGGTWRAVKPFAGATCLELRGPAGPKWQGALCPNAACIAGETEANPLRVMRSGDTLHEGHDYQTCDVACMRCKKTIGKATAALETLFGLDEDAMVAREADRHGWKVY